MRWHRIRLLTIVALLPVLVAAGVPALAQSADVLARAVEAALHEERGLRCVQVTVSGAGVTLTGRVDTFWAKHEALRRTLDVPGVGAVESEIAVPAAESDERLAEDVGRELREYPDITVWDYVGAVVDQGVVTLAGWVTPELDKAGEIFERVARLRGVQDIRGGIQPLPASLQDDRLRRAIGRRVFGSLSFMRFGRMRPPPFRILVSNSTVTLTGYVQNDGERRELELLVAEIQGVVGVSNQLLTFR